MRFYYLILGLAALLFSTPAPARNTNTVTPDWRKVVVIIDSGYNMTPELEGHMCSTQYDLTNHSISDVNGHGTNIASIIAPSLEADECITMIKFWHSYEDSAANPEATTIAVAQALNIALQLHAKYVNMSFGGPDPSPGERIGISLLLKQGAKVIVAAGNDAQDLSRSCDYYPACYGLKGAFYVVANYCYDIPMHSTNHHGPVNAKECGHLITAGGYTFSGTSQSAAVHTARLIRGGHK